MHRVAVVLNNVEGYARGILRGVMPFAFARGWKCDVQGIGLSDSSDNIDAFDGMIAQLGTENHPIHTRAPLVNVSSSMHIQSVSSVICDDQAVGRLGAEHFLRQGFRNFIWYAPLDRHFAKLRQTGFVARIAEAGFESTSCLDRSTLTAALCKIEKPVAIMCCNDTSALAVLEQCRLEQFNVPDQVAVLGVDNDDLIQSLASPPLSSIGTATEQIGFEAAVLLERLMTHPKARGSTILIPPTGIIARRSTDLTAVSDAEVAGALRFIREHANGPMDVDAVQRGVSVSRRQLERRFRSQLGRSMLDEIRRCRVDRARQLLLETDLTIPQIATASGFSSASYLTVVFGKAVSETPGHFRKKFRRQGVVI